MNIVKEKIAQITPLLEELGIDAWLIYVRESSIINDPIMPLIVGHELVWPSYFLYTTKGDAIAIVGHFDKADFERSGNFTEVLPFTKNGADILISTLDRIKPKQIAINYSTNTPSADGLTHGMYLRLGKDLGDTSYAEKLVSGEDLCMKLRSRKSPGEVTLLENAAQVAGQAWYNALPRIKTGMTEIAIAKIIESEMAKLGSKPSFETIVNAGSKTEPGHGSPTDAVLEPGDLLHVDFGALVSGYCSDIQRLAYFKKDDEVTAPEELQKAFSLVRDIVKKCMVSINPGMTGNDIDSIARKILTDNNYPEYQHALGHQLGQYVHDGGALLGPHWPQYGKTPDIPLEKNFIFTVELEIMIDGIGCAGLEEDIIITDDGGKFLSLPQLDLPVR